MTTVIERPTVDSEQEDVPTDGLFTVWFDVNCGRGEPDWWWEMPGPQPLAAALNDAAKMRANGWVTRILPDGENPRPDGRWDNP